MLEITSENFDKEVMKAVLPVLIDFWAPWCMPCKMLSPTIDKLAEEFKGKVVVGKVNVDDNPDIATNLSILNIPTLILMKNGSEALRMVGVNSKEAIIAKINSVI